MQYGYAFVFPMRIGVVGVNNSTMSVHEYTNESGINTVTINGDTQCIQARYNDGGTDEWHIDTPPPAKLSPIRGVVSIIPAEHENTLAEMHMHHMGVIMYKSCGQWYAIRTDTKEPLDMSKYMGDKPNIFTATYGQTPNMQAG